MRAEASVPHSIGNGRECMVYQSFRVLALSATRGQAAGERGLLVRYSHIVDLLVFLSPMSPPKSAHTTTTTRLVTAQISLDKVLRYHYGIKFPSFSVLPEVGGRLQSIAHTPQHNPPPRHFSPMKDLCCLNTDNNVT